MEHSKLLINESPLIVLPSLVMRLGFEKAIILQQIQYLIALPHSGKVLDDGHKYIWNTSKDFVEFFPFWKPDTIARHLRELEKQNFIISCQPLVSEWDRTKFYRINYVILSEFDAGSMLYDDTASIASPETDSIEDAQTVSSIQKTSSKTSLTHIDAGASEAPEAQTSTQFNFPLKQLFSTFPDLELTPAQVGIIEVEVKPEFEKAWIETINHYKANHNPATNSYLPQKVGNLLNVFKNFKGKQEKAQQTKPMKKWQLDF